jgi:FkbH-like protein
MKVKLVIWDLDDTLWSGTLAEGDELHVDEQRVSIIQQLNSHGIVNSICSKNDFSMARSKLESLGLWDLFVFPKISFAPKGPIVKQILDEMHLRAENTIFIDDNSMNLREVEHYVPGISCWDALDDETTTRLNEVVAQNSHVSKSRLEEYRILEAKAAKSANYEDNQSFLESCNIRVSRVFGIDNLPYVDRIEELINRTNQLNFTMNRVEAGSMALEIADNALNESWSLFAWDDYGDYGLIGFAMVRKKKLIHFLFSCRTMNMGIEGHVMHLLSQKFPDITKLVEPKEASHITMVNPSSSEGSTAISRMQNITVNAPSLAIMANCQGGIISHYMGATSTAKIEQWPKITTLQKELKGENSPLQTSIEIVIIGLFNDYDDRHWDNPPSEVEFRLAVGKLLNRFQNVTCVLILPAESLGMSTYTGENGVSFERVCLFNSIARSVADTNVKIYEIADFLSEEERISITDSRHYPRDVWMKLGKQLRSDFT